MNISELVALLERLRSAHISYKLAQLRDSSVAIEVAVPGERWEIEVMADGNLEVERFVSEGNIRGVEALEELFANFSVLLEV